MNSLLQDLRYALRAFTKNPTFSAVAVATLALGIGANAAIFALVDRVLIRTLPVVNPGELVLLRSPGPKQGRTSSDGDDAFCFSYPTYHELAEQSKVFAGLIGEVPFSASIAARGETERASGELVTGNYFGVLGVPPALGRVLTPADDRTKGAHPVAVLSHGYWQRRFGGDPSVIGKPVIVNGESFTIVGVSAHDLRRHPGRPARRPLRADDDEAPDHAVLGRPRRSEGLLAADRRAPEARPLALGGRARARGDLPPDPRAAAAADDRLERRAQEGVPQQEDRAAFRRARTPEPPAGIRDSPRLPDGDGRPRSADRLLEPGGPAGRPRRGPAARVRHSPGDRREPRAAAAPVDRRMPRLLGGRRRARPAARGLAPERPALRVSRRSGPAPDRGPDRPARARLRRRPVARGGHPLRRRARVPRGAAGSRAHAARPGPRLDDARARGAAPAQRPRHRPGGPDARPARGGRPLHPEPAQPLARRARREGRPRHRFLHRAEAERLHLRAHRGPRAPADRRPQGRARCALGHGGDARHAGRQRHGQLGRPGGRRQDRGRPPFPHELHRAGLLRHARHPAARGPGDRLVRRRQRPQGLRRQRDLRQEAAARQARHRPAHQRRRRPGRQAGHRDRRRRARQQGLAGQRGARAPSHTCPTFRTRAWATSTSTCARKATRRSSRRPCARR